MATLSGIVALALPLLATAGETAPGKEKVPVIKPLFEKPVWLTELSLGVKESWDSNIYLSGVDQNVLDQSPATAGQKTLADQSSWVTTLSPKIGVNFAPLLGKESIFQTLSLGYVPDFVIFHDASSESYSAHRFTQAIKGKADAFSFNLENAFIYIDGDKESPIYPGSLSNAYGTATVRERREQIQDRSKISLRFDTEHFFIRPTASLLYYNLDTDLKETPIQAPVGYQNWVDRYDVNGGADLGYKLTQDFALTAGYRYGHQYQAALPWDVTGVNASNDYQRALFGVEGKPVKWLKVEAAAGPDFRNYSDTLSTLTVKDKAGNTRPADFDLNPTDVYAEATVTVTPTDLDTLVFKYKRWNWVSSTGKNPYLDNLYDLSYRHQITKALTLELGARAAESDYNPASLRNDWMYTLSGGLRYALTTNLSVDASYSYDHGFNDQPDLINPDTRAFDRSVISLGMQWKF